MAAKYVLKRSTDNQVYFNLKAENGETILTSERYKTKQGAERGINSVRSNSPYDSRYNRLTSSSGEPYFTLRAENGQVIGLSEMYSSTSSRENGIRSCKQNGSTRAVEDQT